ncbi:MAG: branched-chain amino acid ABC transporter ATP-binding protein/permease [Pseudomonadota bacterium]|nr:branched-chain amino acid ABC transporter ATP-binding protein/permease [Pseudomonadota bacterium]MDQ2763932.1 branched-chain amino acid ABC transporter ATP-binding protein/permease [Pseudomonadota bacterium]
MNDHLFVRLVVVAVVAATVAWVCASPYIADAASYAVVLAIFSVAVGLTFGQLGYVSFGHAAFLGLGAYAVGLLTVYTGLSYWVLVPLSVVPGLLLGGLVGWASVRVGGAYFAIATLTLAEMLRLLALNWVDVTRGPMGMLVMVPPLEWARAFGWGSQQAYLFVLVAVLGLVLVLLSRLIGGPLGRAWAFVGQAPALAQSVGIPAVRARVINVALSGGIASLAGGLLIPKALVLSPDLFSTSLSATGLLSVVLGGKATLIGPVIGGLLFGLLPEALRAVDQYRMALFALMLLVSVRVLPGGLTSLVKALRRPSRTMTAPPETKVRQASRHFSTGALAEPEVAVDVRGLGRRFGGVTAVKDVSFKVGRGELVGLIGPNGAGKTTCFSMISGFLAPSEGEIWLNGASILGLAPSRVAAMGLVRTFQQTAHCASLSVGDNVLFACYLLHREQPWAGVIRTPSYRAREAERIALAMECLTAVGLQDRTDVGAGTLSYGDQKLLGVAIALAARPRVLLLDEPAAGLNHTEGLRLVEVLRGLQLENCTIVIIDHNLPLLMSICERIVVLQHGEKIAEDRPAAIAEHPQVLKAYLGAPDLEPQT